MSYTRDELIPYVAGILDGEGCITINYRKGKKYLRPGIYISNTSKDLMNFLSSFYPKWHRYETEEDKIKNHKTKWEIRTWNTNNMIRCLEELFPFLIVKKEHAKVMLKFLKLPNRNRQGRRKKVFTEKEMDLYRKLKILNRKGVN